MKASVIRQGHFIFLQFFDELLEFVELALFRIRAEFLDVEMLLTFLNVVVEPLGDGLHVSIPRVARIIRMAVVAGALEDGFHFVWRWVEHQEMIRTGSLVREIFFRTDELNADEYGHENEEKPLHISMGD